MTDHFPGDQEVYEAMDDKGSVSFSTVLSANDEDDWLLLSWVLWSVRDFEQRDVDISVRSPQRVKPDQFVIWYKLMSLVMGSMA